MPLCLSWWDQDADLTANLERLVLRPGGRLLAEDQLVLATEVEGGPLAGQVLHAIASGHTQYHEINDAVRADAGRALDRMVELRLTERVVPVTEDPRRTRRRLYHIADNFLRFWLSLVDRVRGEIERGLGPSILPVLLKALDEHSGPQWEDASASACGGRRSSASSARAWWRSDPTGARLPPSRSTRWRWPDEHGRRCSPGRRSGRPRWTGDGSVGSWRRRCGGCPALLTTSTSRSRRERVTHAEDLLVVTAADVFP